MLRDVLLYTFNPPPLLILLWKRKETARSTHFPLYIIHHCQKFFYGDLMSQATIKFTLVNKTSLLHNLFLVYLSISTFFGRLWAHRQVKQLCLCDTWYLLFCVDDSLVCRSICSCIPDSNSGDYGPIIRRNNCVYATLSTCYSVWMTVWYAGAYAPAPHRITSTKCRINNSCFS